MEHFDPPQAGVSNTIYSISITGFNNFGNINYEIGKFYTFQFAIGVVSSQQVLTNGTVVVSTKKKIYCFIKLLC